MRSARAIRSTDRPRPIFFLTPPHATVACRQHCRSCQTMATPSIRTTVVGSYPVPEWLAALPSQQALIDATRVVFKTQEMAGIDVVADGELYRFDVNHPDTNGMIEYFIRPMSGIRSAITR